MTPEELEELITLRRQLAKAKANAKHYAEQINAWETEYDALDKVNSAYMEHITGLARQRNEAEHQVFELKPAATVWGKMTDSCMSLEYDKAYGLWTAYLNGRGYTSVDPREAVEMADTAEETDA